MWKLLTYGAPYYIYIRWEADEQEKEKVLNKVLNNIIEPYELNKPFLTYFYDKNGLNVL